MHRAQKVEISDPQKNGEGRLRFISYLVTCNDPEFSSVRRRYSDFHWLYQRLDKDQPGAIIPILTHHNILTVERRFSEETVSIRQRQCANWINRLLNHPELRDATSLRLFLTAGVSVFTLAKNAEQFGNLEIPSPDHEGTLSNIIEATEQDGDKSPSALKTTSHFPRMRKFASKVRITVSSGPSNLERCNKEEVFERMDKYVSQLESCVQALSKYISDLLRTLKDRSSAFEAIG